LDEQLPGRTDVVLIDPGGGTQTQQGWKKGTFHSHSFHRKGTGVFNVCLISVPSLTSNFAAHVHTTKFACMLTGTACMYVVE
jgi:hypothetical protein